MKKQILIFLVVFLLGSVQVFAETIREIEVQGNHRTETKAILSVIKSRPGQAYSSDKTKEDIKALYRLGSFNDVKIEKKGAKLIYIVSERANISKISFLGQKKVKEDKLRELSELKPYTVIDTTRLDQAIKKIRDHYAKEGYHLAEIQPEYKTASNTIDQELVFHIREGEPVRIKKIQFIGNKVFSDKELRKAMKSKERGYWSWLSGGGKYQDEIMKLDTALLNYHYQNHGYLRAKIGLPKVYLTRDRRWITLTYHVTEGEKYKVSDVGVVGDILTSQDEMISKIHLKSGQYYSRKTVEEDLSMLSQIYGDQGYAFASINPDISPNDEARTAAIQYRVQKGPKVMIDRINISGNTMTRDKVIRREILVKENTLYNETNLRLSKERLEALGYFQEVNFATPRGSADDRINVNISVKERPTGTFSIGAGFSSVENFIFTASVAKQNFLGYGLNGQFSVELSSKRQLFLLSLEDPYFLDSDWSLGVSGYRTVNVFSDFDRQSFGGSVTLGHRIFDYSSIRVGYQIENVDVNNFRTTVPQVFAQNLSGLTSSGSVALIRDTRNNRLFPTKGMYNSISFEYAGLGGDSEFMRATENFRLYQPIWKNFVGKLNFTMAQMSSLNSLPVPLFERFFLGGVNSLRGYDLRSIGPSVRVPSSPQGSDNRFVYGGNKMAQLNLEIEFPLYEPAGFRAVTFFDAGNTFSEEENFSFNGIRTNYGFGIRWNSPLGPLRFEWGFPISRKTGEGSSVFNFTIGSFF